MKKGNRDRTAGPGTFRRRRTGSDMYLHGAIGPGVKEAEQEE